MRLSQKTKQEKAIVCEMNVLWCLLAFLINKYQTVSICEGSQYCLPNTNYYFCYESNYTAFVYMNIQSNIIYNIQKVRTQMLTNK